MADPLDYKRGGVPPSIVTDDAAPAGLPLPPDNVAPPKSGGTKVTLQSLSDQISQLQDTVEQYWQALGSAGAPTPMGPPSGMPPMGPPPPGGPGMGGGSPIPPELMALLGGGQ
jgi:hypothetical protein